MITNQEQIADLGPGSRERLAYYYEVCGILANNRDSMVRRGNVNARRIEHLENLSEVAWGAFLDGLNETERDAFLPESDDDDTDQEDGQ